MDGDGVHGLSWGVFIRKLGLIDSSTPWPRIQDWSFHLSLVLFEVILIMRADDEMKLAMQSIASVRGYPITIIVLAATTEARLARKGAHRGSH
jgi:hypothetical protein